MKLLKIFLKLFGAGILVYAVNFLAIVLGAYAVFPAIDIPMHFFGGVAIGILAYVAWDLGLGVYEKPLMKSIPFLVRIISIISFVALVGVVWEWHEFLLDYIHIQQLLTFVPMQPGVADTMMDLFLDILGGCVVVAVVEGYAALKHSRSV